MAKKSQSKISTRKIFRAIKSGSVMTHVGMKHLGHIGKQALRKNGSRLDEEEQKNYEKEVGQILFAGLSQLRGTALKASQLLSLEAELIPDGIRDELAKSCYQVPPLNRALIRKVFVQEFGQSPNSLFTTFDSHAFAAASLGQVHKAEINDGESLAVKIQYPGIRESIDSDLQILRFALKSLSLTTSYMPNKQVIETTLDEIGLCLRDETNYIKEADNTNWFRENIDDERVVVPKVYSEFSSSRIIALEYLQGKHVDSWLETNPSQETRNNLGRIIFELFLKGVFELKVLHADPHMGNYLFLDDGRLGFLDFGCVKRLDPSFLQQMTKLYDAFLEKDDERILSAYKNLNILSDDFAIEEYTEKVKPILAPVQSWFVLPFTEDEYDFSHHPAAPKFSPSEHKILVQHFHHLKRDQLYFDRTYFGVCNLLKVLGAKFNVRQCWQEMVS